MDPIFVPDFIIIGLNFFDLETLVPRIGQHFLRPFEIIFHMALGADHRAQLLARGLGVRLVVALATLAAAPTAGGDAFISQDLITDPSVKSGYTFALIAGANVQPVLLAAATCNATASFSTYHATATPVTLGSTGTRSFGTNNSGTIWQNFNGILIPVGMAGATVLN